MPRPSPLKAAAAAAGLTLADVARETGYSPGTLGQVSGGYSRPWPELRRRLESLFGFDPYGGPDDHLTPIREAVAASRSSQGLPATVVDERTIQKVADLLGLATPARSEPDSLEGDPPGGAPPAPSGHHPNTKRRRAAEPEGQDGTDPPGDTDHNPAPTADRSAQDESRTADLKKAS